MIPVPVEGQIEGGRRVVFGANQPGVTPIPGVSFNDGKVLYEFALTAEELAAVMNGANLRLWLWTADGRPQPCALQVVGAEENA